MSAIKSLTQARAGSPWGGANREAVEAYKRLQAEFNATSRDRWDDPEFHRSVAADIQSIVDYGFMYESLFPGYFDVEQVGEFDRPTIRERRGLKVFYTSRGGYIEESQLRDEVWELPRDTMGFHISEFIDKLRADFATNIEDIVTLGKARLEGEVHRRILGLMQAAIPSGSANYSGVAGITKPVVDAALAKVRDAIRPDGQGIPPVTILGRAQVSDKVAAFDHGFDPEAVAEVRRTGRLGTYMGANLVTLHHYQDEEGVAFMPANELWIFAGSVGKFVAYGDLQVKSWDENTVDYRHYRARKDFGGLVHHPEVAFRFVDSTVTA